MSKKIFFEMLYYIKAYTILSRDLVLSISLENKQLAWWSEEGKNSSTLKEGKY